MPAQATALTATGFPCVSPSSGMLRNPLVWRWSAERGAVPQFHVRNEEGLVSLCCNSVRKWSYLLEVEVFGLGSQLSLNHFSEP